MCVCMCVCVCVCVCVCMGIGTCCIQEVGPRDMTSTDLFSNVCLNSRFVTVICICHKDRSEFGNALIAMNPFLLVTVSRRRWYVPMCVVCLRLCISILCLSMSISLFLHVEATMCVVCLRLCISILFISLFLYSMSVYVYLSISPCVSVLSIYLNLSMCVLCNLSPPPPPVPVSQS